MQAQLMRGPRLVVPGGRGRNRAIRAAVQGSLFSRCTILTLDIEPPYSDLVEHLVVDWHR